MKRLTLILSLLGALTLAPRAGASGATFDASSKIKLREGTALSLDFESADRLVGYDLTKWKPERPPRLERKRIDDVATMTPMIDDEEPIEGSHSLYLGAGQGLVIGDPNVFGPLANGRLEVTLWVRAEGNLPVIQLAYSRELDDAFSGYKPFGQVTAIRSGRETNDGWAEYTSGPIDGSFWGRPLRGIVIAPSPMGDLSTGFSIDALEVTRLPGEPMEPKVCTQANVASTCGSGGDCMFGHCLPSEFSWGVLPPPKHREEIVERWALWSTRFTGDRNAAQIAKSTLVPKARELARSARSSREFFGGMFALVGLTRDQHTFFGNPFNFTAFRPVIEQGHSADIGACFGVVEKDLVGGGLGFAVYSAEDGMPATDVPLKRGDVLTAIDGRDPKAWLDEFGPRFIQRLPNDPEADWSHYAYFLTQLLLNRASTMTLARCASSTECTGASRETLTVDIGKTSFDAMHGKVVAPGKPYFCSPRFSNSVATLQPPVSSAPGPAGETRVQFDDFGDTPTWKTGMTNVFASKPAKVMMDARMGRGGSLPPVEHLLHLVRGTSEPTGFISIGRGTYELVDPPWLFERTAQCSPPPVDFWQCFFSHYAYGVFTTEANPPGAETKIAWLNALDGSANDYAPRLLKGRSKLRIFAPHRTAGAYGSAGPIPPLTADWNLGTMQFQDTRFGADAASAARAQWESGHGVEPDERVVQKLSDTLSNVDTMVKLATEWLAAP